MDALCIKYGLNLFCWWLIHFVVGKVMASVAHWADSTASASQSQWGQGPAGSNRVINIMWRRLRCVQQRDGQHAAETETWKQERGEGERGGGCKKTLLSLKDRQMSGYLLESVSFCFIITSRCKNHFRSHNLKPGIFLPLAHCQRSPSSPNEPQDQMHLKMQNEKYPLSYDLLLLFIQMSYESMAGVLFLGQYFWWWFKGLHFKRQCF